MTNINMDHIFTAPGLPAARVLEPPEPEVVEGEVIDGDTVLVDGDGNPLVNGAELLDRLRATIETFMAMSSEQATDAVTLWIAASHVLQAFQHATRLVIKSPEKRCGKSRLLDIIQHTCHEPLLTTDASTAAVIRSLDQDPPPTLLIDEADALWGTKRAAEQNEDLRSLINAGFQRGRDALRCVGPNQTPTKFKTFGMAALAGIRDVPDTISDRAVVIALRRRKPNERVTPFRERRDVPTLNRIRDQLADWAVGAVKKLEKADEPDMPVEDRAADTWEPLVLIAELVGGDWPERARTACKVLTAEADESDQESSLNLRMLSDIRDIFTKRGVNFLSSVDLVDALRRVEESPWDDFGINVTKLAHRLKDYGVKPVRNAAATARGYKLESGLHDAFARYLRQKSSDTSDTPPEQGKSSDTLNPSDTPTRQMDPTRQNEGDDPEPAASDTSDGLGRQTDPTRQTVSAGQTTCLTDLTGSDAPPATMDTPTCSECQLPLEELFADEGTHPGCDLDE